LSGLTGLDPYDAETSPKVAKPAGAKSLQYKRKEAGKSIPHNNLQIFTWSTTTSGRCLGPMCDG
jgi:hypothetical protein